jgi:hypothetical protein
MPKAFFGRLVVIQNILDQRSGAAGYVRAKTLHISSQDCPADTFA